MKNSARVSIIVLFILIMLINTNLRSSSGTLTSGRLMAEPTYDQKTIFKYNALPPSHVLVDVSHGNEIFIPAKASIMGAFLEGTQEFNVTTFMWEVFNDSVLADVDVLVIMNPNPNVPYSVSEIQAIKNYWDNGGSILFVGTLSFPVGGALAGFTNHEINRLNDELGMEVEYNNSQYPSDHAIGLDTDLPIHPITYNLNELYQRGAQIHVGPSTPTQIISNDKRDHANIVVWNETSNRAVFLGSTDLLLEDIFSTSAQDPNWNNYTHRRQFIYNVYNWLSYRPIKTVQPKNGPIIVDTGFNNTINQSYLDSLEMYTGAAHLHTLEADPSTYYSELTNTLLALKYDFVVVADYNTVEGGPILREFFEYNSIPINVINGEEATKTLWHTTGWGINETIDPSVDPHERIQQFHDAGTPICLAHPEWLVYHDYPRIWDFRIYPFDGFEVINSGFLTGAGNLAEYYPFYGGCDAKSPQYLHNTINYVLSDRISDNADWWTEAFFERRIVVYSEKDDVYVGDRILVDEVIKRLNETGRLPFEYPNIPSVHYPRPGKDSTTTTTVKPSIGFLGIFVLIPLVLVTLKRRR